jgi:hypothetical protein
MSLGKALCILHIGAVLRRSTESMVKAYVGKFHHTVHTSVGKLSGFRFNLAWGGLGSWQGAGRLQVQFAPNGFSGLRITITASRFPLEASREWLLFSKVEKYIIILELNCKDQENEG